MTLKDRQLNAAPREFYLQHIPLESPYHYRYEILTPKYIDQVIEVFTTAFCRSEPMTAYLQMDENQYRVFARAVTEKASDDKLSVIALDGEQVVACALTEDLADPGALPDFDPKFAYILALLEALGKNYFSDKMIPKNKIAHLFITAVHERYRHRGLSRQVNFRAMDVAAQRGFDFIYCEFTHYFNMRGTINHLENPKKLIGSRVYKEFLHDGMKPFAQLEGSADAYLWALHKDAKIEE